MFGLRTQALDVEVLGDEDSAGAISLQGLDRFWDSDASGFFEGSQALELALEHLQSLKISLSILAPKHSDPSKISRPPSSLLKLPLASFFERFLKMQFLSHKNH